MTPTLVERFSEGDCHILARRLHRVTKGRWPVCSFTATKLGPWADRNDPYFKKLGYFMDAHVFNRHPCGLYVDIEGLHPDSEAFANIYGYDVEDIKEVPLDYVIHDWGTPGYGPYTYYAARREADRLVERYGLRKLRRNNV